MNILALGLRSRQCIPWVKISPKGPWAVRKGELLRGTPSRNGKGIEVLSASILI